MFVRVPCQRLGWGRIAHVSDDDPTDEVLLELGRMTWAAMALEETTYLICRTIKPGSYPADRPIGQRIDEALKALAACRDAALREQALVWLVEARAALEGRNRVLHSVHMIFVPMPGTEPLPTAGPYLAHVSRPKKGTNQRRQVHTPLTTAGLEPVRRRLQAAEADWTTFVTALYEARRGGDWDT
jgi:hypothetical protein